MITHVPGFQSFFRTFASFCTDQISQQLHKGLNIFFLNNCHFPSNQLDKLKVFYGVQ